jgi:uncharacterized membrane protein YbhN (UPF0104 family)
MNKKQFLLLCGKIVFALGVSVWLINQIDFPELFRLAENGDSIYLLYGSLLIFLSLTIVQTLRLHALLYGYGIAFPACFRIVMVSLFFNSFLPTSVGGDMSKVFHLGGRTGNSLSGNIFLVLFERFVGGIVFLGFAFFVYLLIFEERFLAALKASPIGFDYDGAGHGPDISWLVYIAVIIGVGIIYFIARNYRAVFQKIMKLYFDIKNVVARMKMLNFVGVFGYSALFHLARMAGIFLFIRFLGKDYFFPDLIPMLFIAALVSILPISIGGLGALEGVMAALLMVFGLDKSSAIGVAFLHRIILFVASSVGGLFLIKGGER